MGLIAEISKRKKICEENSSSELSSPVFGGAPNPHPCLSCHSPRFWFDRYGGGPHCAICRPWPSRSLAGLVVDVLRSEDGSWRWSDGLSPGGQARPPGGGSGGGEHERSAEDREFDQRYRTYEIAAVRGSGNRPDKLGRIVIERKDWTFLNAMILD